VSAHVVAKPKAFSESDEEERTTLESSWEEEPSTTVEEGDAADRIRELSGGPPKRPNGFGPSFTSTTGSRLEEPTVDDQHMPQGLLLALPVSRLVVTGGNDTGQELEVKPGKSYTIGRAIGNDIVLTDIAVSRQHFDLRNADGSWVLVDRGSGNGTVVNGNIEDNPFMLANGDVIEIGNTQFRFDLPNGAPRSHETMDVSSVEEVSESDIDAEEMSTVVGKPLRTDQVEKTEIDAEPYTGSPASLPAPLSRPPDRARGPSSSGPLAPLSGMPSSSSSMPTTPIVLQAPMAAPGRGPAIGPQAPTLLAEPGLARPGMVATTLPGQGMMSPSAPPQVSPGALYGYPSGADIPRQNVAHNAQMLVISPQGRRSDASTQHVAPIAYGMRPSGQRAAFVPTKLSQRTKLIVAGVGLTLLAMVITVAVIRSGGNASGVAAGSSEPPPTPTPASAPPVVAPKPPAVAPPKLPSVASITPPAVDPPKPVAVDPPKPVAVDPPKPAVVDPPKPAVVDPPKPAVVDPPKPVDAKRIARQTQPTPKRQADPPKTDSPKPEPKRVAAAVDISSYKSKADDLYHSKRFNDAAQAARAGIKVASDDDAHALKSIAALYEQLGRWYSTGMGASTKPTDAFAALRKAENLDRSAGGAFTDDIHAKLSTVAPKAAVAFYVAKDYENAYTAVRASESLGAANGTVKTVRDKLETSAGTLYNEASKDIDSSPDQAKDKLRRIQKMVDAKSQWYVKSQKLLGS